MHLHRCFRFRCLVAVGIGTGVGTNALLGKNTWTGNGKKQQKLRETVCFLGVIIYACVSVV